jgi:predicted LPLAT superfamily acyltransferase
MPSDNDDWRRKSEAGSAIGIRFMAMVASKLGRKPLHFAVIPLALYFLIVRGDERKASREYLARVLGYSPSLRQQFSHFLTFARVIADRYFFILGRTERISIDADGTEKLQRLVDQKRGGIVLSAHFGSFEAARVLGGQLSGAVLRIVLDKKISRNLVAALEVVRPGLADVFIDLSQPSASLALEISDALQRGEWVGFLADRSVSNDRTASFEFLGSNATFPLGPVIIAGIFKVPLVSVFPIYRDSGYQICCEIINEQVELPRKNRDEVLCGHMQKFVASLEAHVRRDPYNWFNFYNFWGP